MKNLLNKKEKGFTLVELLVVIAILAVLATVSVVGYTSFIKKANDSNALTECKQAEEVALSDLVSASGARDSDKEVEAGEGKLKFSYDQNSGKINFNASGVNNYDEIKFSADEGFSGAAELGGKFYYYNGSIIYVTSNGKGFATWESGKMPEADVKITGFDSSKIN